MGKNGNFVANSSKCWWLYYSETCIKAPDWWRPHILICFLTNVRSQSQLLTTNSINTQVIIQNRALWLVRYLGLSADNHLDEENGCQSFARLWWNKFFRVQCFSLLFWNNHLCIYTKTIIRLRLSDSRWIFTSTSSRWIFTDNHFAFGE